MPAAAVDAMVWSISSREAIKELFNSCRVGHMSNGGRQRGERVEV